MWKKSLMTDAEGNPYCDSEGNELLVPVVGYVVTDVKSPMAAPFGVNAHLSGDGYQVTVDWTPSPDETGALMGYNIYRSCDSEDPVQVNGAMLASDASSFVDSSELQPGKIYAYYVVACYENGSAKHVTMTSKSSSVVWGIPLQKGNGKYAASIMNGGSLNMVVAMGAMGVATAALGITMAGKKKAAAEKAVDEE
jgi:hypothetical protein